MIVATQRHHRRGGLGATAASLAFALVAFLAMTAYAPAQEAPALLDKAKGLAAAGKTAEALDALDDAAHAIAAAGKPALRRIVLTEGRASGFGIYEQRTSKEYDNGVSVHIYSEPMGLVWGKEGDIFVAGFAVSIEWTDERGNVVVSLPDALDFSFRAYARARDIYSSLNIDLDPTRPLPPGPYTIRVSIADKQSGKRSDAITTGIIIRK